MDKQPPSHQESCFPSLFTPSRFIDHSIFRCYYAFGNTPAEDLLEHVPDSIDTPSILQLGCGDMRSCLYTLWKNFDKQYGHGNFKGVSFYQNDYSAAILARNVIFIHLILKLGNLIHNKADILEIKQMVSSIWNIWFCHELHHAQFVLLKDSLNELSELFLNKEAWSKPSNPLKQLLEFSTNDGTMEAILSTFKMWLRMLSFSIQEIAILKSTGKMKAHDYSEAFKYFVLYCDLNQQAKGSELQEKIVEIQKECNSYLATGNAFSETLFKLDVSDDADRFLNPTLYEKDDEYTLHYDSIPYTCFTQYVPCIGDPSVKCTATYQGMPLVDSLARDKACLHTFSLQQFSLWLISVSEMLFKAISRTPKYLIKFKFSYSDALMFCVKSCHTHKNAFDVIHTSNLIDHLSPLAVVVSAIPLLKKEGILLTTTMTFGHRGFKSGHDFIVKSLGFQLDRLLIFGIQCIGREGVYTGDGVLLPIPSYFYMCEKNFVPQTILWKQRTSTPLCLTNLDINGLIAETLYRCIKKATFPYFEPPDRAVYMYFSIASCSHSSIRALCLFLNQLSLQSPVKDSKFWEGLSTLIRNDKNFRPFLLHLQCQAIAMNIHMHLTVTESNCPICNNASLSTSLKKFSLRFTPAYGKFSEVHSIVLICLHPIATDPSSLDLSNPAMLNSDIFLFDSSACCMSEKEIVVDVIVLEDALKVHSIATLFFHKYSSTLNKFIATPQATIPLENSTSVQLDDTAKYTLLPNPSSKLGWLTLFEYTEGCFKVNIALSEDSLPVLHKHSLTTKLLSDTEFKVVTKSLSFHLQFSLPVDYNKVSIRFSRKGRIIMIDAPCKAFDTYSRDRIPLFFSNPDNTVILSDIDVPNRILQSSGTQYTFAERKTLAEFGRCHPSLPPVINMKEVFISLFQKPQDAFFSLVKRSDDRSIHSAKYGFIVVHRRCFDIQNQTAALDLSYYIDKKGMRKDAGHHLTGAYFSWAMMRINSGVDADIHIVINGNEISVLEDVLTQFYHRTRSLSQSRYPLKGYGLESYFRRAIVYFPSGTFSYDNNMDVASKIANLQVRKENICNFCQTYLDPKDSIKCSKCLAVLYCEELCQKNDWPKHKLSCQDAAKQQICIVNSGNPQVSLPIQNVTEKCSFCKAESSLKKCSRCKSVAYCSKACQRDHWSEHKKTCKATHE